MTIKAEFVQHRKRLEAVLALFLTINLGAIFLRPDWLPFLWALFLPAWLVLLWRVRCWNCRQRLLKDGAAHIEWRGPRLFRWKMGRHKTCGAELS